MTSLRSRQTVGIIYYGKQSLIRNDLYLRHLPLFSNISENEMQTLLEHGDIKTLGRGDIVHSYGEEIKRFYVILGGWVKLFRETNEGKESVVDLLTRNDIFGESALFNNTQATFSAQVVSNSCSVLSVPLSVIKGTLENNPLSQRLLGWMVDRIAQLRLHVEQLTSMTSLQRVATYFLQLYAIDMEDFTLPCDKSLLAQYLGMKPETFSRVLGELREQGVTIEGHRVMVSHFENLLQLCPVELPEFTHSLGVPPLKSKTVP